MTSYKLLWDDPVCDIEVPERLLSSYEQLEYYHLVGRCVHVPIREGSEEEIMLVHSSEYLEVVKSTQTMNQEELRRVSKNYDAVYFHPNSYRCAKLAVGATLQLVDSVMSGKVLNGMALVRPPGHHSQRNAANGFCVFNNVAIAAQYAKRRYGLQRILIVDWDVHHGQGIQYIFEEDPSVLYYSWHRYEHQKFWPLLRESDYDAVGQGNGKGFNINVPWNKVGMGNSDYLAAFFHVLLPVAFEFAPELILVSSGYDSGIGDPEGEMKATPECFAHLTHFLMQLANGRLCAVLEGGYHLKSLSESVSMTVKTLLGDPLPRISGEMAPCLSSVESIQNVRAAHKPYWKCLMYEGNCCSVCFLQMWLINMRHDAKKNTFFSAVLGFILPVAYSYQPDLTIIVIGPNRSLGINGISLLTRLLQGLAESRSLVVIQVRSEIKLVQSVAKALTGVSTPDFGPYAPASQENVLEIRRLRDQLQQEWKMLQCSGE
uniref:Histone deacetylase 10 n=1 Tax=Pelusios castaneus TaxID=367368 RepID=A0A8C8RUC0_9SAUR